MKSKRNSAKYKWIGATLSIVWLLIILIYLLINKHNPFSLKPNEFGDFFAGAFGPVAILWIVLGFWQQGDELRNSVDALNVQSEELRNSVEQQQALVKASREQVNAEKEAARNLAIQNILSKFPKFALRCQPGFTSPDGSSSSPLVLHNLGVICMDIEIWDKQNASIQLHKQSSLEYEETIRFHMQYMDDDHSDFA